MMEWFEEKKIKREIEYKKIGNINYFDPMSKLSTVQICLIVILIFAMMDRIEGRKYQEIILS